LAGELVVRFTSAKGSDASRAPAEWFPPGLFNVDRYNREIMDIFETSITFDRKSLKIRYAFKLFLLS
jgi:hypothetical protein